MSFRTVVIKERCKLEVKLDYLVCRGEKEIKIYIPEISVLILETTAVAITTALISSLIKNNVKIIFCDEKHNPESELLAYYGNYTTSRRVEMQVCWTPEIKSKVWSEIIKDKINKQANFLYDLSLFEEYKMLQGYIQEVQLNDTTNREGHSAKVYFNALYGANFGRRDENAINIALNYGYAIILSCFNREIVKSGYITQLGIWHKNEFNQFNLASDLMEPFRVLVDKIVFNLVDVLDYRDALLELFNTQLKIDGRVQYLENAISIYCQSVFNALNTGDIKKLCFYEL